LVWHLEGLSETRELARIDTDTSGELVNGDDRWLLVTDGRPRATARGDGSFAGLVPDPQGLPASDRWVGSGGWFVGSTEAGPSVRVNADEARATDLRETGFGALRPFSADYCTPAVQVDANGRLRLGLRDDLVGALYLQRGDGWERLGHPVRDVAFIDARAWGDTVLIEARAPALTYCPQDLERWPTDDASEIVLRGDSVQLVYPGSPIRVLTSGLDMHPSGRCAVLRDVEGRAEVLDVPTGASRVLAAQHPAYLVWLQ